MPDLNDLDRFDEGIPVNPMPASEVRRRGDRMRRRNTVLASVGGVAAAAVFIGVPVAIVANQSGDDDAQPVNPSGSTEGPSGVAWVHEVPEDFPLIHGMPEKNGDGTTVVAGHDFSAGASFCPESRDWPPQTPQDWLGAAYFGESEDTQTRSIYVFGDESAAADVLDATEAEFTKCPEFDLGNGSSLVHYEVDVDLGTEESLAYATQTEEKDGTISGLDMVVVARTGNAVYVARSYGSAGGDSVIDYEANRLRETSSRPLASMCLFAADPCGPESPPSESESATTPPVSDALAEFPLDLGYPETNEDGSAVEVTTEPGVDLIRMCDEIVWDPYGGTTDLIGVEYGGPEDFRGRTLAVFKYEDQAVQALSSAAAWLEQCPEEESDAESGASSVYEVLDVDLGDQAVGWTQRYRTPDGFSTGLTVYHLVRVGNTVYASYESGEGGGSDDSIGMAVLHATDQARPIVEAMEDL